TVAAAGGCLHLRLTERSLRTTRLARCPNPLRGIGLHHSGVPGLWTGPDTYPVARLGGTRTATLGGPDPLGDGYPGEEPVVSGGTVHVLCQLLAAQSHACTMVPPAAGARVSTDASSARRVGAVAAASAEGVGSPSFSVCGVGRRGVSATRARIRR